MTLQAQASTPEQSNSEELTSQEAIQAQQNHEDAIAIEQQYRASAYSLIASLLRQAPDQNLLDHVSTLSEQTQSEGDDLMVSMCTLGLSAKIMTPSAVEDEFQDLFIGLGKGEVVPYGSWYLTGFLMEKPLSDLRDDLSSLGYVRNESSSEPEDHAAALSEVIALMIGDGTPLDIQKEFFQSHMVNWFGRFFNDLTEAKSSVFYKALGRFGSAFTEFEKEYFSMKV